MTDECRIPPILQERDCLATVSVTSNGEVVATLNCCLVWPHLDQPHRVEWPIDDEDRLLTQLERDLYRPL